MQRIHEIPLRLLDGFAFGMDAWNLLDVGVKASFFAGFEYRGDGVFLFQNLRCGKLQSGRNRVEKTNTQYQQNLARARL